MLDILRYIASEVFEDEFGQIKFILEKIKQFEYKLLAILASYYRESLFSYKGNPVTVGGPIIKEDFGSYIYCDTIYYNKHDSMVSTTGLGFESGKYKVYIFNYPENYEEEFEETFSELKSKGLKVVAKDDTSEEAEEGEKVIEISFKSFFDLVSFADKNLESKLS